MAVSWYNIFIAVVVACGAYGYGFGFGVFNSSIGQPGFYSYMHLNPTDNYTARVLGATSSLFAFGALLGCLFQGSLADRIGRKRTFAIAGVTALIGAALVTGSVNIPMLVTVRVIHGIGLGMLLCLTPLYNTEIAPPKWRGIFSGMTTMGYGMGYLHVGWISFGTFYASDITLQWRMPLALAAVGPLLLLIGLPFIPESPRFLCWVGRYDEAYEVLKRIHRDPKNNIDLVAEAEFTQIKTQVEYDKSEKPSYTNMFKKPSWKNRVILTMVLGFAQQATGVNGISNYLVTIAESLGYLDADSLLIYALYSTVGTVFVYICCLTVDKVGRRTMFLMGFPIMAALLLAEAMLQLKYLGTENAPGRKACLAVMFLYIICFQTIDGPVWIWISEALPTSIRAKGVGLAASVGFIGYITFTAPGELEFEHIRWGTYLIYCILCIISTVIVYLYIPETKGLPVEEIAELFGDTVVVHLTEDLHGIKEKMDDSHVEVIENAERKV